MKERVVITGIGVLSPNAHGVAEYSAALRAGRSGIRFLETLAECKFGCQVGGIPHDVDRKKRDYFSDEALYAMNSLMIYAGIAGIDCWRDAGLVVPEWSGSTVEWDTGAIVGTGAGGNETLHTRDFEPKVKSGHLRRLGSTIIEETMCSSASAKLGGLLALGGHVTTNSSACATGTEAIVEAYFHIAQGRAKRMLAGSAEGGTETTAPYAWAGFDAMRVTARGHNDAPEKASRPMSATAGGLVPSAGAGLLLLESLTSARERGAKIYAEVLGGSANCGGQRGGGTMTSANREGVVRCIRDAVARAGVSPREIDAINGHLTATNFDPGEIAAWSEALDVEAARFPPINATKSLIGHALGASGALECIAAVLELHEGFLHPSINCEDLNPALDPIATSVVRDCRPFEGKIVAKASFGFGDVNACAIFGKWSES